MNVQAQLPITPDSKIEIRKVWHNDEWYFSIVDVISWATGRDYPTARRYWNNLKAELRAANNQLASQPCQLKMLAADGKKRLTDAGNAEQILRIVQEIPGAKTNEIKDWLAQVGAERLEETETPEIGVARSLERAAEKYRRQGKTDEWIEIRIQGIIVRKQFIEALKAAVIDMVLKNHHYATATDIIYMGLWGRTAAYLKGELQLPKNASLRDNQPELALMYQQIAEKVSAAKLGDSEEVTWRQAQEIVRAVADLIGEQAQKTSRFLGVDLATGKPLLNA